MLVSAKEMLEKAKAGHYAKQNPLYEDNGFTYLDTHYYGGIKKWQWVTLPLAIHGVVAKKNGEVVDVVIGEDDNDPVFCVTDLLIHLSREQQTKPANTVVEGENLDLLIGSQPLEGTERGSQSHDLKTLKRQIRHRRRGFPLSRA